MSKSLLSILLAVILPLSCISFAFAQDGVLTLKNADIMTMVRAKLPPALIIEKINTSNCSFDTFPSVLAELKYKGVPDEILMAMVQAPHGGRRPMDLAKNRTSGGATVEVPTVLTPITIPDGTPLEVEATYTVSSAEVEEGSAVSFTVVHPVIINGATVIARGARATARVTKAKKGGSWGRAGTLAWMMQDVTAVDGSKVPLEFSKSTRGDSKGGTVATGIIVTGVLFWPAAPFWGFKKGKDAKVPAGRRFDVSVHGNANVQVPVPAAQE
ncbi:MAG TPA: hypothetical protein VGQ41_25720 [Pyrinomonadaceae bacterium]|jgi:hypothetical protein|nr:hypothetical protein [Pyrinomonadaceae bacterium]